MTHRRPPPPQAESGLRSTQAELDEFIENTNLVISALGISAFQPKATSSKARTSTNTAAAPVRPSDDKEPIFELTVLSQGVQGLGQRTASGFLVLEGSTLRPELRPSAPRGVTPPGNATRTRSKTTRWPQTWSSPARPPQRRFWWAVQQMAEQCGTCRMNQLPRWRLGKTARATKPTSRQRQSARSPHRPKHPKP